MERTINSPFYGRALFINNVEEEHLAVDSKQISLFLFLLT